MNDFFLAGLEAGMSKEASPWGMIGSNALIGAGIGGVGGAINSDPGSRMRGFFQGAAVGGGAGALAGGVMARGMGKHLVESGGYKGLTHQNVGQAMRGKDQFAKVTGLGDDAWNAAQTQAGQYVMDKAPMNLGAMVLGAGAGGAMLGGASNPYYRYGYPSYGYGGYGY